MTVRTYEIKRWDGVMFGNSITKVPIIYIEPDLDFLEFIRRTNFAVLAVISGTDTIYDADPNSSVNTIGIPGVVDKSCFIPNCRPNFYDKTGLYVVTLAGATWNGYPHPAKLGRVSFKGLV
jgi:hypothetical protein